MTRALGIDIGHYTIKIAELESSPRGQRLLGLYEIPRNATISPGLQLRDFLQASGVSGERIAIGMGDAPVYVKRVEFPFSDQKRLRPAVVGELEDSLPFEIVDHVLDTKPLGKNGRNFRYLVGLCPPAPVEQHNHWAEEANVMPAGFFLDTEALGQLALGQNLPSADGGVPYLVVDLGHRSTKVAICTGARAENLDRNVKGTGTGEVLEMRTLNRGSHDLVSWIRDRKNVSEEDARQWLIHRAEIKMDAEQGSVSDELKVAIRPVIVELYQTLQAFRGKSGLNPGAMYLTGGMSGLRGFREFMSEELRLPIYHWPIASGINTDTFALSSEQERSFAVAIALSYRFGVKRPLGWLNFRRSPQANKRILSGGFERLVEMSASPAYRPIFLSLLAAFVFCWAYSFGAGFFMAQEREAVNRELAQEFTRLDRDLGRRADKFVGDLARARELFEQNQKKKLQSVQSQRRSVMGRSMSDVMLDLSQLLPANVKMRDLKVSAGQFDAVINGAAPLSADQFTQLQKDLRASFSARGYASVDVQQSGQGAASLRVRGVWKGKSE